MFVESVFALERAEANHVVAAPVLVEEFATAFVEDFLNRRIVVEQGSMHVTANLIEERLWRIAVGGGGSALYSLCLCEDDVGEAEDWHVVTLIAVVCAILIRVRIELDGAIALTPSVRRSTTVERSQSAFLHI